jgi:hypothetical protein
MSRTIFPYAVADISGLARSLHGQLADREATPGHLELLNMLSRSAGCRNFQHFRAMHEARERLETPPAVATPADHSVVEKIARHFDAQARLLRWPAKASHQQPCLWVLWSRLTPGQVLSEKAISEALNGWHLFGDHALLRRELFGRGLVTRTADGREYRRIEREPPPDARALIRHLGRRQAA